MKIVIVAAALVYLLAVWLYRVYHSLPSFELKRRARGGGRENKEIYKAASFGKTTDVLLVLLALAAGAFILIVSARFAWWLALIVIGAMTWLEIFAPRPRAGGWLWKGAALISPAVYKSVGFLLPALQPLGRLLPDAKFHSGIYEKEDLLQLLNAQNRMVDNRIDEDDLKMAYGALTFGDKKVDACMIPRRKVHFVLADDLVGPVTIDELHKTGQVRFPVVKHIKKNIEPEIIGTLLLADIVGLDKDGPVQGVMHKGAHYINESSSLHEALDAFTKTRAHLLVVVNNFDEVSGVLSLEDVLNQILPKPIEVDFSDYADRKAVAGLHSQE